MTEEPTIPEVQISGSFLAKLDEIYVRDEPLPATTNVVNPDYDSDHELFFEFPSDFIQDPDSPYSFLPQSYHGGNDSDQRLRYYKLFKSRQDEAKAISDKALNVVNKANNASSLILAKAEWRNAVSGKKQAIAQWDLHILQLRKQVELFSK